MEMSVRSEIVPREVYFDAIAELIPEQREFWLRCEATDRERLATDHWG
jgi:hypothetical protein